MRCATNRRGWLSTPHSAAMPLPATSPSAAAAPSTSAVLDNHRWVGYLRRLTVGNRKAYRAIALSFVQFCDASEIPCQLPTSVESFLRSASVSVYSPADMPRVETCLKRLFRYAFRAVLTLEKIEQRQCCTYNGRHGEEVHTLRSRAVNARAEALLQINRWSDHLLALPDATRASVATCTDRYLLFCRDTAQDPTDASVAREYLSTQQGPDCSTQRSERALYQLFTQAFHYPLILCRGSSAQKVSTPSAAQETRSDSCDFSDSTCATTGQAVVGKRGRHHNYTTDREDCISPSIPVHSVVKGLARKPSTEAPINASIREQPRSEPTSPQRVEVSRATSTGAVVILRPPLGCQEIILTFGKPPATSEAKCHRVVEDLSIDFVYGPHTQT